MIIDTKVLNEMLLTKIFLLQVLKKLFAVIFILNYNYNKAIFIGKISCILKAQ